MTGVANRKKAIGKRMAQPPARDFVNGNILADATRLVGAV
jgi:hypothetical protein